MISVDDLHWNNASAMNWLTGVHTWQRFEYDPHRDANVKVNDRFEFDEEVSSVVLVAF